MKYACFFVEPAKLLRLPIVNNEKTFAPSLLISNIDVHAGLQKFLGSARIELSYQERENLINDLVSLDAMRRFRAVKQSLGTEVNSSVRGNVNNPNVVAVLLYLDPSKEPSVSDATFTISGAFDGTGWGADPKGTQPFPDQHPL